MPDFLFEIFSDEIPARMQEPARIRMGDVAGAWMREEGIAFQTLETFVTPRRLTLIVRGLAPEKPSESVEKQGPPVSAGAKALAGFCRAQGITEDACAEEERARGRIWIARYVRPAERTEVRIPELCLAVLKSLTWPKNMYWANSMVTWIRPVHSLLCLYDDRVISWAWDPHGIALKSGNETQGHRFAPHFRDVQTSCLCAPPLKIPTIDVYEEILRKNYVLLRTDARRSRILSELTACANAQGCAPFPEDTAQSGLIDEVVGLVEWPTVFLGAFDSSFLTLPEPLITTTLRTHQRYFPLKKEDAITPLFGITLNGPRPSAEIREGCERVVHARLSDALFFWNKDREQPLESYNEILEGRVFFKGLGSLADKVRRLEKLAESCFDLSEAERAQLRRSALLCKADLATGVVGEFPELQGTMGRFYAHAQGEAEVVCRAIEEHYWPRGAGWERLSEQGRLGRLLGILDRVDTLVGFFVIAKEIPSGSRDPMALRRAAFGLERLLRYASEAPDASTLFHRSLEVYRGRDLSVGMAMEALMDLLLFCSDKSSKVFEEEGLEARFVSGVSKIAPNTKSLWDYARMAQDVFTTPLGGAFLAAFNRINSLLYRDDCVDPPTSYDIALFQATYERALHEMIASPLSNGLYAAREVERVFAEKGAAWVEAINAFLDNVLVDEPAHRANRLGLLNEVMRFFLPLGDLSHMGKT